MRNPLTHPFAWDHTYPWLYPVSRNEMNEDEIDSVRDVGEHPGLDTQLNSSSYDGRHNLHKTV